MSAVELITVIAAAAAAVASVAASIVGVINALNQNKTHRLVDGLATRSAILERESGQTIGYAAGVRAETRRQRSADPPAGGYREGNPPSEYR